jgi:RimJ/RimL family protein N-acetyltransferase
MADISDSLRSSLVYLDNPNEYDAIMIYKWFLASAPERLTCRPINFRTEEEIIVKHRERMQESSQRDFAVRRTGDNCLLGRVTYFDLNRRNRTVEIGFLTERSKSDF